MNSQNAYGSENFCVFEAAPTPERLQRAARVVVITGNNNEESEFLYPYYRFSEEGYQVDVATPQGGAFQGKHGTKFSKSKALQTLNANDYALVYLPGGKAPAELRQNQSVISFVQQAAKNDAIIASICHGAQILVTAGLIKGKRIAAWPEVQAEVEGAGATFVNEALVEDGQFITARMPGDLPRHLYGALRALREMERMTVVAA